MAMNTDKEKRNELKGFFKQNMIPTEGNFANLIDSMALKDAKKPLMIAEGTDGTDNKKVVELYRSPDDQKETWSIGLQHGDKKGLSIENGEGKSCLFIDEKTGSVGMGIVPPKDSNRLHVIGDVYIQGNLSVEGKASKKDDNTGLWNDWQGSDARLKDTEVVKDALKLLLKLNGVSYTWKKDFQDKYGEDFDDKIHFGFIAQNVEANFRDWTSVGKTYKVGDEEFQALGIRISPTVFEFQALAVESLRELDNKIKSVCHNGIIKAKVNDDFGQKGLLFSYDNGNVPAWMHYTGGAENILEIGAIGDIRLNTGGSGVMMIGDHAGKHLRVGSDQVAAKGGDKLFLQKEGGNTEIGGDIEIKGKLSLKESLELSGNLFNVTKNGFVGIHTSNPKSSLHIVGDAVFGLDENNKKFIIHSRCNENGDFLQISPDSNDGNWAWSEGITLRRGGNVGIGTMNPTAKLHVAGDIITSGNISFGNNVRQMLNLWGTNYGIGVQDWTFYFRSDAHFCWYAGGAHNNATYNPGSGGRRLMCLNNAGDLVLSARTNPYSDPKKSMCRALVDSENLLVINFENDYSKGVYVGGSLCVDKFKLGNKWLLSGTGDAWGNDDWLRFFNTNGTASYYGGVAVGKLWVNTGKLEGSDIRLKKNICDLKDSLKKITALKGVQFEWQESGSELGVQLGLIAQEVEPIFPELVQDGPDGFKGINYSGLIAPLIEAVKEQQIQLSSLSEQVDKLKKAM